MDIDLTDTTWTGAEKTRWRQFYTPIIASISLVFCIVAQCLYFKTPRLLKFPRCLLCWLNFYNMYYCIFVFFKWLPGTPWHEAWATKVKPGSPECMAGIWFTLTQMSGPVACDTLMCLTVFLVTVRRINIENKPRYFWSFFSFAFVYPFVAAFPLTFAFVDRFEWKAGSSCAPQGAARALSRIPNATMWFAQIVMIAISLHRIRKVITKVNCDKQFPVRYVVFRFLAILLSQLYTLWPALITQSITNTPLDIENAIWQRFSYTARVSGPILDSIVMILGNHDFIKWMKKRYFPRNTNRKGTKEAKEKGGDRQSITVTDTKELLATAQSSTVSSDSIYVGVSEEAIEMNEFKSNKGHSQHQEVASISKNTKEEEGGTIITN